MDLAKWSCRRVLGPLVVDDGEVAVVFDGWRDVLSWWLSLFGRA